MFSLIQFDANGAFIQFYRWNYIRFVPITITRHNYTNSRRIHRLTPNEEISIDISIPLDIRRYIAGDGESVGGWGVRLVD
jgi:hypothetical protein